MAWNSPHDSHHNWIGKSKLAHGWRDLENLPTIEFDPITRRLWLYCSGKLVFFRGRMVFLIDNKSIIIDDVTGRHCIYFDAGSYELVDGGDMKYEVFVGSDDKIPVTTIWWNADDDAAVAFSDELHSASIDGHNHEVAYRNFGMMMTKGGTITTAPDNDGSDDSHAQVSLSGDWQARMMDRIFNVTLGGTPSEIPIIHREEATGDVFHKDAATSFPLKINGVDTRPSINTFSGGLWIQQQVTSGSYFLMHLFCSNANDPSDRLFLLQGIFEYTTLESASVAIMDEISGLQFSAHPFIHLRPVASFVFQTDDSYTNTVKARIVTPNGYGVPTWLFQPSNQKGHVCTSNLLCVNVVNNFDNTVVGRGWHHGLMAGKGLDDHPQYAKAVSGAERIPVGGYWYQATEPTMTAKSAGYWHKSDDDTFWLVFCDKDGNNHYVQLT